MKKLYPWQSGDWSRLQALRARTAHGLLLKGPNGIGKLELAMHFAQSLLCQNTNESNFACGQCPSCHWFEQGTHPDFRLLQPEALNQAGEMAESGKKPSKQISVEQIRGMSDFFGMTAHQGDMRIIIIHPAETMNTNAANALLKSLEEPTPGLMFILVTHKPQQLLSTILSRCFSVLLTAPDVANAKSWLEEQGVADPEKTLAASGYAPLQAIRSESAPDSEERKRLLSAVRLPATLDAFALAELLQKSDQQQVIQWLQQWSYDLNSMKAAGKVRYHPGSEPAIMKLVGQVSALNLARLHSLLQTAKRESQHTLNPKLFFESVLLAYRQLMLE